MGMQLGLRLNHGQCDINWSWWEGCRWLSGRRHGLARRWILANSVEVVGAIAIVTLVCCCSGEVTAGLASRSCCMSYCSMLRALLLHALLLGRYWFIWLVAKCHCSIVLRLWRRRMLLSWCIRSVNYVIQPLSHGCFCPGCWEVSRCQVKPKYFCHQSG